MSVYDFAFGGLSGMIATTIVLPLDIVKVRMQLLGEQAIHRTERSFIKLSSAILHQEGPLGFYKGLDAAIFRQATYSTTRLGIYKSLFHAVESREGSVSYLRKVQCSLAAGVIGAMVSCPSELALVRFQSDGLRPAHERRNYRNVFDAFRRIVKEEGVRTLWRGSKPNVARAAAMNVGMLSTYDEIKERINRLKGTHNEFGTLLTASFCAGIVCSFLAMPFDNAKIKLQNMKKNPGNSLPYRSLTDCLVQTVRKEGVRGLWTGYPTFAARVGQNAMLILLIQEFLHSAFNPRKAI